MGSEQLMFIIIKKPALEINVIKTRRPMLLCAVTFTKLITFPLTIGPMAQPNTPMPPR